MNKRSEKPSYTFTTQKRMKILLRSSSSNNPRKQKNGNLGYPKSQSNCRIYANKPLIHHLATGYLHQGYAILML